MQALQEVVKRIMLMIKVDVSDGKGNNRWLVDTGLSTHGKTVGILREHN